MTNLQRIRLERGLSQSQLANAANVNLRSIQAYEQKTKDINKTQLQSACKLAKALSIRPEDLLEEEQSKSPGS